MSPGHRYLSANCSQNLDAGHIEFLEPTSENLGSSSGATPIRHDAAPLYLEPYQASTSLVDTAVRKGKWGMKESDLINANLGPQSTEIPDCTASQNPKYWRVSGSALAAYVAMRGPYQKAGRDLFVWMDRCSKTFQKPKECNEATGSCQRQALSSRIRV